MTLRSKEKIIFQNLSFTCFGGGTLFIQGKNGCGKTSLLRIIAGIQPFEAGTIFFKNDFIQNLSKPYALYIGHDFGIRDELTVIQNLLFWSKLYDSEPMLGAAIKYWDLEEVLDIKCYKLSSGNKKKVALAKLLCCHSDLWLLDEVDTTLDRENIDLLKNLIRIKMESGGVIVFATHSNAVDFENRIVNTLDMKHFV